MKNMRSILTDLLSMPASDDILAELPEDDQTNSAAICAAMIEAAAAGNVEAAQFIRRTIHEDPTDELRMLDIQKRYDVAVDRLNFDREKFESLESYMQEPEPKADPEAGGAE